MFYYRNSLCTKSTSKSHCLVRFEIFQGTLVPTCQKLCRINSDFTLGLYILYFTKKYIEFTRHSKLNQAPYNYNKKLGSSKLNLPIYNGTVP